jgi:hypothetical protein
MPTCRLCGVEHETEDLCRHEQEGVLVVHCPDCHAPLGYYRSARPNVDTLRD